jgi:hypothetical protein
MLVRELGSLYHVISKNDIDDAEETITFTAIATSRDAMIVSSASSISF